MKSRTDSDNKSKANEFDPALEASICWVEVDCQKQQWHIALAATAPIDPMQLEAQGRLLCRRHEGLQSVTWLITYQLEDKTREQFLISNWNALIKHICWELNQFKGWLDNSALTVSDGRNAELLVRNQKALHWLLNKNGPSIIAAWLREKIKLELNVRITCPADQPLAQVCDPILEYAWNPESSQAARNRILLGQNIQSKPIAIRALQEEQKSVVLQGEVMEIEIKRLLSRRTAISLTITDFTDSIQIKSYLSEKEASPKLNLIKPGSWLLVRGGAQIDRYSQELVLNADDINLTEPPKRSDQATTKRVELHLHTKMSAMDGMVDVEDLIARVADWGHSAVAITDHGVVQAFPAAWEAAKKCGIKLIYGMEGYLVDVWPTGKQHPRPYHIVILAKNLTGVQNLYRLVSQSHLKYFYRRPRLPRKLLHELREGLIFGTACESGELIQAYLRGESYDYLRNVAAFYDFIEVQPLGNNDFLIRNGKVKDQTELIAMNRTLIKLGQELSIPVVATGDVHFLDSHQNAYRGIIQAGKGFEDAESQAPLYLRTTEEMLAEFNYLDDETAREIVINWPNTIAELVEPCPPVPDDLYAPKIEGADEMVKEITWQQALAMYGEQLPAIVIERLEKELAAIVDNGYAVLYLIAHRLVKKSNEDGYLVGSRGSVGSSLVATLMGITEVNPLPPHYRCRACGYSRFFETEDIGAGTDLPDCLCEQCAELLEKDGFNIPFETFMGYSGDKVPDIDLNFSGEYQLQAHRHVEEMFGHEYVFRAGTINTIAERTAFGFVKKFMEDQKLDLREPEIKRLVKGCSGVKRTTGQHPGGLMVVPRDMDIHMFTPLQRPADDTSAETITTHFDYEAISSRLIKLDILGHDDPTVLRMLQVLTGVDPKSIKFDEPATLSLFSGLEALHVQPEQIRSKVGTIGIPEFGTRFVRQMLEETQPKTFADLVRISGFSHGTDVWLNNAQELIRTKTVELAQAISNRDDIMLSLIQRGVPANQAFRIMEDVRKGKGVKTDQIMLMEKHEIPGWFVESCQKIKYMFPKAHAVAYVMMAFRIAYFKVYYPEAFYASFYTVRAEEFDAQLIVGGSERVKLAIEEIEGKGYDATAKEKNLLTILEVALEMYERGFTLLPVDLMTSHSTHFQITARGIVPPFIALQGIGKTAAANIVEARNHNPFTSIQDLRIRSRVSRTVIDVLQLHGCLAGMAETDQLAMFDVG